MGSLNLPTIATTKRTAEVRGKKPSRNGLVAKDVIAVPDSVGDVQEWLDRVFGNYELLNVTERAA